MNLAIRAYLYQRCCCNGYSLCEDCSFQIAGVDSGISTLSAGAMTSACGTIGDYLIEWRVGSRDGITTLVSGIGADPDIQTQHPFVNEPVSSGDLYPVLKYVVLNGIRYTTAEEEEGVYSNDGLDCVFPMFESVAPLACGTTFNADANYDFIFTYNSVTSGTDKSREFRFDLDSDDKILAWGFTGFQVTDGLEFFYCTASDPVGTLIENWRVGVNLNSSTNYLVNPQRHTAVSQVRTATNLNAFTYQAGDYIRIEITGSLLEPENSNTNWTLKCKCLPAFDCYPCDCDGCLDDWRTPDLATVTMAWNASNCAYYLEFDTVSDCTNPHLQELFRYAGTGDVPTASSGVSIGPTSFIGSPHSTYATLAGKKVRLPLFWNTTYTISSTMGVSGTFTGLSGTMTVAKSGSTLTYSFTNATDYSYHKTQVQSAVTNLAGYVNDNTQIEYYRYLQLRPVMTVTSCGDNMTQPAYNVHMGTVITYDDVGNIITFALNGTITNGISATDCNNLSSNTGSVVTSVNSTYNLANFSATTVCRRNPNVVSDNRVALFSVFAETVRADRVGWVVSEGLVNDFCTAADMGGCVQSSGSWRIHKYHHKVTLTDPTDHTTRLNNYKLEQADNLFTNPCASLAGTYTRIYEVQNGAQIFP